MKEAQLYAFYKTFIHRIREDEYVVIPSYKDQYTVVLKADALEEGHTMYEPAPDDFASLSIQEIEELLLQENCIEPFYNLRDSLMSIDPEVLSFLIQKKLPWELFIKMYLAYKGYNKLGQDVDYDVAKKEWLENS